MNVEDDYEDQDSDLDQQSTGEDETEVDDCGFTINLVTNSIPASSFSFDYMGSTDIDYANTVHSATDSSDSKAMLPKSSAVSSENEPLTNALNQNIQINTQQPNVSAIQVNNIDIHNQNFTVQHAGGVKSESKEEIKKQQNNDDSEISLDMNSIHSFHKNLFKLHFGTDDLSQAHVFMNNEIKYIQQIQEKQNAKQYVSIEESLNLVQSRYYALFMAQLEQTMANNKSKNKCHDLNMDQIRYSVTQAILLTIFDDIQCFGKIWFKHFVQNHETVLLTLETSSNNIKNKTLNRNIFIQMSDKQHDKYSSPESFLQFLKTIIPSDWNKFLNNTIGKILKNKFSECDNPDWNTSFKNNTWKSLFHDIMQIESYEQKKTFRTLIFKICAQSGKALYKLISMSVLHYDQLKQQIPDKGPWEAKTVWTTIKFALAVWPQIIGHYLSMFKYICKSDFGEWDIYGALSFYLGCFSMWAFYDPSKWNDEFNFVATTIPITYYGLTTIIEKSHSPNCFNLSSIINSQFNTDKQENHWTSQNTPLCFAYIVALFELHYDKLGKIFGAGEFTHEEHFQSHLFDKNQLNDQSVQKAFDNFITQSTKVLTDDEEKEIMNTLTSLTSTKLDTYGESNRVFLSKYTNPSINLHQRMYKQH